MIYISTGGWSSKSGAEAVDLLLSEGYTGIELSGGAYSTSQVEILRAKANEVDFLVHNYFPPPRDPFVLNLASANHDIGLTSVKHVEAAIQLSSELGGRYYSVHAGFLVDPDVNNLGRIFNQERLPSRMEFLNRFIDRIGALSQFAESYGISLLIENNVLTKSNLEVFGSNPLLMTTPEECEYVMSATPENVNMLLDVAHLKVSAITLGYSPELMFSECSKWIRGYHLSDNDGLADSNSPYNKDAWFWGFLNKNLDYYSIEVYTSDLAILQDTMSCTRAVLQGK